MKKFKITSLVLLLGLVILSSCKGDDPVPPSAEEVQLGLLAKTWNNGTVNLDGTTDQGDWSAFKVTFTDGSYTSSGVSAGRELVWPTSGTWGFKNAGTADVDVNKIVRDDGVEISISVSESSLTMTFAYDESINGRVAGINGIDGDWVFGMTN